MNSIAHPVAFLRPGARRAALERRYQDELTVYVGRRSDSLLPRGNGARPPLSERDLERDAELQEVTRAFSALRALVRRDRRNLYVLWGLTTLLVAIGIAHPAWRSLYVGHQLPAAASAGTSLAVSPAAPLATTVSSAPVPASSPELERAPVPAAAAASAPPATPEAGPPIVPPAIIRSVSPAPQPRLAVPLPKSSQPASKARPAQVPASASASEASAARPAVSASAPAPATGAAEVQRVFSIEAGGGDQQSARTAPPAPVAPSPPAPGATAEDPAPKGPRRVKYGHSGVVTLLQKGAVVFDATRRAHRLVPPGGELPDGSILREVDPKAGKITTDRGEVQFVQ